MTIENARSRSEKELLDHPDVFGVAIGETATGQPAIRVIVRSLTPELKKLIPHKVDGFPVEIDDLQGGEISAL